MYTQKKIALQNSACTIILGKKRINDNESCPQSASSTMEAWNYSDKTVL